MLPIREILERHGTPTSLEEMPQDYRALLAGSTFQGHKSNLFVPPGNTCWIVEQDKPASVENFSRSDWVALPGGGGGFYHEGQNQLPRCLTLDADTIRLCGVGIRSISTKRRSIKRVMDE
jgi:hypothetical protein